MSVSATPAPASAASSACARVSTVNHLSRRPASAGSCFCQHDQSANRDRARISGAPCQPLWGSAAKRAARSGAATGISVDGRDSTLLPTVTGDQLAAAVVVLDLLHRVGLAAECEPEQVATALDDVAVACSPYRDLTVNPAKSLASGIGDTVPLLWGGSVLAARAARRVAESIRRSTGRAAVAADAEHLLPILEAATPVDVFADPFESEGDARPSLVVLDDDTDGHEIVAAERALTEELPELLREHMEAGSAAGRGEGG